MSSEDTQRAAASLLGLLSQALVKSKHAFTVGDEATAEDPVLPRKTSESATAVVIPAELEVESTEETSPTPIYPRRDPRTTLSAEEVQDLLRQGLEEMPGFPECGVNITVYGSRPWNAMLSFAAGSTSHQTANALRGLLQERVQNLRATIDVETG